VDLVLEGPPREAQPLDRGPDGFFTGFVAGLRAGVRYRYRLDGHGPYPDPASRFQPSGVHGPSEVVDPRSFRWSSEEWRGPDPADLILYELHVGTFSPEGTFAGVVPRLQHLVGLGVTALELMPVADFPGDRNWGYDGVSLFAPARCYGRPDDLRRLVDAAHRAGLTVLLDVVYNHLGPDGAYVAEFSPSYFSRSHRTPWGAAMNLDGEGSGAVREFFVENALHWLHEYRVDGLRLDATHALVDDGPRHFLAELGERVRDSVGGRRVVLIGEDNRNLARLLRPEGEGGYGLDAVWSDDFHHQVRRRLAGDHEGYFRDFTGSTDDVAATVRRGWFFTGQESLHHGGPRGTQTSGIDPRRFVFFVQNHDQVGNRALGERLSGQVPAEVWRAAAVLLATVPETPLLFMGQEWACASPFLYFTDHNEGLGRLVTEGRRTEFASFSAFADAEARRRIPDPQDAATFLRSRLDWSEPEREPHASSLRLYRRLLWLRRTHPLLQEAGWGGFTIRPEGKDGLVVQRRAGDRALLVLLRLEGSGSVSIGRDSHRGGYAWTTLLTTEDDELCRDPLPPALDLEGPAAAFARPGGVILEGRSLDHKQTQA
jgi:maltooligosyltrehalose trehalohydrolase